MMTTTTPLYSGRAVGNITLGASVHDVLTRLKAQPNLYPSIELQYSPSTPVTTPIVIKLPKNGLRLRFDGPDQRLRLIEVLDFNKIRLSYKNEDILKKYEVTTDPFSPDSGPTGPTFRHIYHKLFGLTYAGEYMPPRAYGSKTGLYVLSYPGVAFSFPLLASAWSPNVDHVSLLSSSATSPASSMAVFEGESWPEARQRLFTRAPSNPRSTLLANRGKESAPDEVESAKIHSQSRIELHRRSGTPFWLVLNETTPQDLITELGAPDAIYRKSDRRLSIHGHNQVEGIGSIAKDILANKQEEFTDTDQSSGPTETEESGDDETDRSKAGDDQFEEFFFNYFQHGFDILISRPIPKSSASFINSPLRPQTRQNADGVVPNNQLVATKVLFHGNVPGSYAFNRHRRSRWTLEYVPCAHGQQPLSSEMAFPDISDRLQEFFKGTYASKEEERLEHRNMVLNRGWGDSPGSSCEILGGWEGSTAKDKATSAGEDDLGNTDLFGFPGLVFEVLKSGTICCLTVF